MRKNMKNGIALVLAIVLVLSCSVAFAWGGGGHHWPPDPTPKPTVKPIVREAFPSNPYGMLWLRKVVSDPADAGASFHFTYTVNGGKAVDVWIPAGLSSDKAYIYKHSLPQGATVVITEILSPADAAKYATAANGAAGTSYTVKLSGPSTLVEFTNSPIVEEVIDGQG